MKLNKKVPLNQLITFQRGFDLPSKDRISGSVPVVASTSIVDYHNVAKAKAPGVIIGRSGSIGGGQYIKQDYWPLNTTLWIKDFKGHNPRYIYYLLKNIDFKKFNVGSGVPTLNRNHLSSIFVPLIHIVEEEKIAHILSTLDDKIELNRQMNRTLEAMAQALFKSWFVDFDPVHAKMQAKTEADLDTAAQELGISRDILDLFPNTLVESEMGMVPEGWEVKALDDVVDFQNGYSFKSKELHTNPDNSIKVFKMGHIHRGGGFKEEGKDTYFNNINPDKMKKYLLNKGDILMAMTDMKANVALLAHTALMPYSNRYLLNQRVGRLRVKQDGILDYPYIYIYSNLPDTVSELRSRSNSGVQVNLTTKAILETKILVPTKSIHDRFNKIVKEYINKIFNNNNEIQTLQKTRDTLLPKLLSGELDVSEIDIGDN